MQLYISTLVPRGVTARARHKCPAGQRGRRGTSRRGAVGALSSQIMTCYSGIYTRPSVPSRLKCQRPSCLNPCTPYPRHSAQCSHTWHTTLPHPSNPTPHTPLWHAPKNTRIMPHASECLTLGSRRNRSTGRPSHEVIRGTHHYKSLAKKMSRCVSVLWKYVTNHPTSIEVLAMHDIKHFVRRLRTANAQENPHTQPGLWGELDVEEVFPNIPKPLIAEAMKFYWSLMCRAQGGADHEFAFFLHKSGDKSLDHVARPSPRTDSDVKILVNDLLAFTHWDLIFNRRLVSFSGIYEQTTGCPMGGSCSAQYANLVLNYLERGVDWSTLPPICRYRDNYLVYLAPTWPLSWVQNCPALHRAPCLPLPCQENHRTSVLPKADRRGLGSLNAFF